MLQYKQACSPLTPHGEIRMGNKLFRDSKAFPRGFAKSGHFTIAEAELLTHYGDTLIQLESGKLIAEGEQEQHFLEVLEDNSKANTKLEKTWLKYIKHARGRASFHTLYSSKPSEKESLVDIEEEAVFEDD